MQAPQPRQRPRQQFRRVQPLYDRLLLNRIARNFEAYGHQLKRERTFEGIDEHSPLLNDRRFRSGFGCSSIVCAKAWLLLVHDWEDRPRGLTKIRFLWALSLLKSYNTENNMSGDCGCDEKTFRYWCWLIIQELADRVPEIIVWENRYVNDIGNDCLVSVDGTDFALAWGSKYKRYSCYKLKGKPGLRYEVCVCLRTSDIVWISGPHYPGLHNDLQIFRMGLIHVLDHNERVEADDGYLGECPRHCKIPGGFEHNNRELLQQRQRNRHETVNERFKNFACMNSKFRHSTAKHGNCFRCIAILTQISIGEGEKLFDIAYNDLLTDFAAGMLY